MSKPYIVIREQPKGSNNYYKYLYTNIRKNNKHTTECIQYLGKADGPGDKSVSRADLDDDKIQEYDVDAQDIVEGEDGTRTSSRPDDKSKEIDDGNNSKSGIKVSTTYTRRYEGKRVKDYGFLNAIDKMEKKHTSLRVETNIPSEAPKSKNLGKKHDITITLPPKKLVKAHDFEEIELEARYNSLQEPEWRFYDKAGDRVNIHEKLETVQNK